MSRLCFVTTTRADWGLLKPLAVEMRRRGHTVLVAASNMHLSERFGHTASEIEADGFAIDAAVPLTEGDSPADRAVAMGECALGMARAYGALHPDAVIALGDRYEMLAAVAAAAVADIPVVHIAGGEISEGAQDDAFRHAITKLSSLHLTATEPYRRRVVQLGEDPGTVVNTGAIGVANIMTADLMPAAELAESIGMPVDGGDIAVVTYHPATLDHSADHAGRTAALLEALDRFPDLRLVITYPNNDAGGASAIPLLEAYAAARHGRVRCIPSLGARRYLSLLRHAAVVVGNSSSGIVEVPSAGIPTVDIGIRQRGRIAADSVIHCGTSADDIARAIAEALSPDFRARAAATVNPYSRPDTLELMADSVEAFLVRPRTPKKFHDLPC